MSQPSSQMVLFRHSLKLSRNVEVPAFVLLHPYGNQLVGIGVPNERRQRVRVNDMDVKNALPGALPGADRREELRSRARDLHHALSQLNGELLALLEQLQASRGDDVTSARACSMLDASRPNPLDKF